MITITAINRFSQRAVQFSADGAGQHKDGTPRREDGRDQPSPKRQTTGGEKQVRRDAKDK